LSQINIDFLYFLKLNFKGRFSHMESS